MDSPGLKRISVSAPDATHDGARPEARSQAKEIPQPGGRDGSGRKLGKHPDVIARRICKPVNEQSSGICRIDHHRIATFQPPQTVAQIGHPGIGEKIAVIEFGPIGRDTVNVRIEIDIADLAQPRRGVKADIMTGDHVTGDRVGADIHLDGRGDNDVLFFVETEQVGRLLVIITDSVICRARRKRDNKFLENPAGRQGRAARDRTTDNCRACRKRHGPHHQSTDNRNKPLRTHPTAPSFSTKQPRQCVLTPVRALAKDNGTEIPRQAPN